MDEYRAMLADDGAGADADGQWRFCSQCKKMRRTSDKEKQEKRANIAS